LYANRRTVLLLDEPDAHLEILRQRQIFQLISDVAERTGSQIIAASHSEVLMNEAAGRGTVIAFVGQPHRMNDRGSQLIKALSDIGWDHYYQAEETGWVLYVEDSTDLAILRAFAETLEHQEAQVALERPFVHYVANLPQRARDHFFGLREAKPDLAGIAVFDRLDKELHRDTPLAEMMWQRREIENYLVTPEVLGAYARHDQQGDSLFGWKEAERREGLMHELIGDRVPPIALRDPSHAWWYNTKVTDDFLDPLFKEFFFRLELPLALRKSDYHRLARFVPKERIDAEVRIKLDAIVDVAKKARPRRA
jgi:hypothetical protein